MADVSETLSDRGKTHGDFLMHSTLCQRLRLTMRSFRDPTIISPDQLQALEAICDKVARIVCGDPNFIDHWLDIEGYARLVRNRLEANQQATGCDRA